ncbi:MAG: GlmU family protein [Chitinophagaceae bacterium]
MNFVLFDDERYFQFLPLTYTRPLASLRCGIWTMQEKWEQITTQSVSFSSMGYLKEKFPLLTASDNIFINSALFPTNDLFEKILQLKAGESLQHNQTLLAARISQEVALDFSIPNILTNTQLIQYDKEVLMLNKLWDLFSLNDTAIRADFERITKGRVSAPLSITNTVIGRDIFVEEGAKVEASILNAETGPIYIGKDAEIMEGSMIRGPFSMGDHSVVKMGAKIYGATTLGPGCKVGGEINNVLFYANSNKAHDGFIGNAVLGEWCNIGADTNNSNLKNNYEEVKLWNEYKGSFEKTGLQFCGLIMADHSKCGINTMFNTGTVVGVSCNIYGAGFPRNFVPSFSWGSAAGFTEYTLAKAVQTAHNVFKRRNIAFDVIEESIFKHVFQLTEQQRSK